MRKGAPGRGAMLIALFGLLLLLVTPFTAAAQDDDSTTIVPVGATNGTGDDDGGAYASTTTNDDSGDGSVAVSASDDSDSTDSGDGVKAVAAADWSPPRTVYIPETGQTIDGVFLDFWRSWGGAAAFGYPITPELQEHGHTVQYYGYARFEYWPQDPDGSVVHLGRIGAELRPAMLRRALPGFGRDAARGTQAARQALDAVSAWQPVDPKKAGADTDDRVYVAKTKHVISGRFKWFWDNVGGAEYLGNPLTEEYIQDGTTYQVFEHAQLAWRPDQDVWLEPVGKLLAKRYGLTESPVDQGDLPTYSEDLFVPPPPPTPTPAPSDASDDQRQPPPDGERWVEISLSEQSLIAWQGDVQVNSTLVSTGREGFETPAGSYNVNTKVESDDMEGVLGGEYYNVPEVPWVMYFTDRGHALHGTYWHSNFGTPMSHGCVNLPMDFAEWLYNWAPMGMRVEIHD